MRWSQKRIIDFKIFVVKNSLEIIVVSFGIFLDYDPPVLISTPAYWYMRVQEQGGKNGVNKLWKYPF